MHPTRCRSRHKVFSKWIKSSLGSCCFGPLNNLSLHHNAYVCKAHVMFYSFLQLPLKYLSQVKHFPPPRTLPFEIGYKNKNMTRSRLQTLVGRGCLKYHVTLISSWWERWGPGEEDDNNGACLSSRGQLRLIPYFHTRSDSKKEF